MTADSHLDCKAKNKSEKETQTHIEQQIVSRCLQLFKDQLKEKQMSYDQLASLLRVSEITVKRMLNKEDIKMSTVVKLTKLLDVDLAQIMTQASQVKSEHNAYFTDLQDKAFVETPSLWQYFQQLFYYGLSPAQIEEQHQISPASTHLYLQALEGLELIAIRPVNNIKFLVKPPLGFNKNSLMAKKHLADLLLHTRKAIFAKDSTTFMKVKPLKMPQLLFEQMQQELTGVLNRYAELSEQAFLAEQELPFYQMVMIGHGTELQPEVSMHIGEFNEASQ